MDASKFVSARDPEVWGSMKYRPVITGDYKIVQENPDFIVEGSVGPTNRILYTVIEGGHKPTSTWIKENCSDNVFDESTGEGYLVLKEGVTSIGDDAFVGCTSLTSIELPSGLTSIGDDAFVGCSSLTEVTCLATNPPTLGLNNFEESDATLYVPEESVETYKVTNWSDAFRGNILPISQ